MAPRTLAALCTVIPVLALATPAAAQIVLQPDAAPPGTGAVVSLIAANGGFTGLETITTSCPDDILIGPTWLSDGAGNPASPIANAVLSTVFFVLEDATPGECDVLVDGTPLLPTGAIDNVFSVVLPLPDPVDGGVGDADGVEDGIITVASSDRSDGGVVVFDDLTVPTDVRLVFDTADPVPDTGGNEAFMPIIVLVRGDAVIDGTVDASGEDGHAFGDNRLARSHDAQSGLDGGDGGHGGPGGGGGAAGGPHNSTTGGGSGGFSGTGGDGFAGGSGSPSIVFEKAPGGAGVAYPPVGVTGGNSPFDRGGGFPTEQVTNGGGGGAGNPFGAGGHAAPNGDSGGAAGYGGGGGAATSNNTEAGGGGGGFATAGAPGGHGQQNGGRGGYANGLPALLPLMGGSGGGGGDGWITSGGPYTGNLGGGGGGGGGGAMLFVAYESLTGGGHFDASGGDGGNSGYDNTAASGGGGGSGGAVFLASPRLAFVGSLDVHGGAGGVNLNFADAGGAGGEGRVRYDGAVPPPLTNGPTNTAGSAYQGCAVTGVAGTTVSVASAVDCDWVALDVAGNVVATGVVGPDGAVDVAETFAASGELTVILSRGGVPSPVGIGRVVRDTDGDGQPDFADADSDNDGIVDADESGGIDLSGDADRDGVPDWQDPDAVDCPDVDSDGLCDLPPAALDPDGDGVPSFLDLDADGDGIPDLVENGGADLDVDRDGRVDDPTDDDRDGLAAAFDADDGDPTVITSTAALVFTDGDPIPDYRDRDADGDGFADVTEAGGLDLDGDGALDPTADVDRDGLDDSVDPDRGGSPLPLPDDDHDAAFDFQDVCGDARLSTGEICDDGGDNGLTACGCTSACAYPGAETSCDDGVFCTAASACDGGGGCVPTGDETPCGGATPVCDEDGARCVACLFADDCPDDGDVCTRATCDDGFCGQALLDLGTPDACDGVDNDCDGGTDEDFAAQTTTCGLGQCAGTLGATRCDGDAGVTDTCDPLAGATEELCDGVDNDCDGLVDVDTGGEQAASVCPALETRITAAPPAVTSDTVASFTFEDPLDPSHETFSCSVDGGEWTPCDGGGLTLDPVAEGSHSLLVRAVDAAGNADPTPAFAVWVVDATVPETTILVGPDATSQSASAVFVFGASVAGSDFYCVLDPTPSPPTLDGFADCDADEVYTDLAEGAHSLWVYAVSPAGVADPTPASHHWVIDTAAPDTILTSGPSGVVATDRADFTYTADDDAISTFVCRVDGGAAYPCDGGAAALDDLDEGDHLFAVAAVDAAGNADPSPALRVWRVDLTAPDTFVADGPTDGEVTGSSLVTFRFAANEADCTFSCAVDPEVAPSDVEDYVPCDPTSSFSLEDGEHTLYVVATDAAGNVDPTPAVADFVVDTSAPETAITSGPPAAVSVDATVTFTYEDPTDPALATFECRLDDGPWVACDGGEASYAELALGGHVFSVRACRAARCDASPAVQAFTVSASPCPLDEDAPTMSCAGEQRVDCPAGGVDPASFAPSVSDACGPAPSVTFEAPESWALGVNPVVFQAVDGNGNLASCVTPVVVEDTTAPSLTCEGAVEVAAASDACGAAAPLELPAVTDACADPAAIVLVSDAPPVFPVGEATVTWRGVDPSGNFGTCTVDVTVVDDTPAAIDCPAEVTEDAPSDACAWDGALSATVTDNCAPEASVLEERRTFGVGASDVTFTATDDAGNAESCVTALTVRDVTEPVALCGPSEVAALPAVIGVGGSDACGATLAVEIVGCAAGDGEALEASACGATADAGSIHVAPPTWSGDLRVRYRVVATDPSGNVGSTDCELAVDSDLLPDTVDNVLAQGGGGCSGGPGPLAPGLLGLAFALALWRRRRRA